MLGGAGWQLVTDVSGKHIDPILKGKNCLIPKEGTDKLCQNVGDQQATCAV
jgi:hypothetical protein